MASSRLAKYLESIPSHRSLPMLEITRYWKALRREGTLTKACLPVTMGVPRMLTSLVPQKRKLKIKEHKNIKLEDGPPRSTIYFWRLCVSTVKTGTKFKSMSKLGASKTSDLTPKNSIKNLKNWLILRAIFLKELIGTSNCWLALTSTEVLLTILSF